MRERTARLAGGPSASKCCLEPSCALGASEAKDGDAGLPTSGWCGGKGLSATDSCTSRNAPLGLMWLAFDTDENFLDTVSKPSDTRPKMKPFIQPRPTVKRKAAMRHVICGLAERKYLASQANCEPAAMPFASVLHFGASASCKVCTPFLFAPTDTG